MLHKQAREKAIEVATDKRALMLLEEKKDKTNERKF